MDHSMDNSIDHSMDHSMDNSYEITEEINAIYVPYPLEGSVNIIGKSIFELEKSIDSVNNECYCCIGTYLNDNHNNKNCTCLTKHGKMTSILVYENVPHIYQVKNGKKKSLFYFPLEKTEGCHVDSSYIRFKIKVSYNKYGIIKGYEI
jgi:hypothetical protein